MSIRRGENAQKPPWLSSGRLLFLQGLRQGLWSADIASGTKVAASTNALHDYLPT